MRHKTLIGLVLIALGIMLFACQGVASFNPGRFDLGPIHLSTEKHRLVSFLPIAGLIALAAGFGLTIVDERRSMRATAR